MYVPIIVYPGGFLDPDLPGSSDVQSLVYEIETALAEATMALAAFEEPFERDPPLSERWEAMVAENKEDRTAVLGELGAAADPAAFERAMAARKIRRRLAAGLLPAEYEVTRKMLYAKLFISRLALIRTLFVRIAEIAGMTASATFARDELDRIAPHLKGLRDSIEHREERAVRQARKKEIAIPQPLPGHEKIYQGEIWVDGLLAGTDYCAPMANGVMGQASISRTTLAGTAETVQAFVDSLPYTYRSPRAWPSR